MSLDPVKEEKIEEPKTEKKDDNVIVPGFLLNALGNIPFGPEPVPHASSWQLEEVEAILDDGTAKTLLFVVETRIRGNEIGVWWYDANTLRDHLEKVNYAFQRLMAQEHMANPLVVASAAQMKTEAAAAGLTIPGR